MNKFCVFCGNPPDKKNKEHIIPKWLIKLTGNENRIINVGINYNKLFAEGEEQNIAENFENRKFSFGNFQFPACKSCNDEFANFENDTSIVFKKVLKDEYINSSEINQLLDWFDKVRIGLWLGSISLDKVTDDVRPKFFIKQRIATRDRALYIYKTEKIEHVGINFYGTDTPGFQYAPCLFGIRINNYTFISYSKEDLLAKNLGFPYIEFKNFDENSNGQIVTMHDGLQKINKPILKNNFPRSTLTFYQAIFGPDVFRNYQFDDYTSSFISNHFPNRSRIFYYDSFEKDVLVLDENDEIVIDGITIKIPLLQFNNKIILEIIEEQGKLFGFKHHKNLKNQERASRIENERKYVESFHNGVKKIITELSKKDYS